MMVYEETLHDFQETERGGAVFSIAGDIIESHAVNRLAMLHITSPPPPTTTSAALPPELCKSCGGSTKRRSPSTPSAERKFHKKIILQHPTSESHHHRRRLHRRCHGFTKLALPLPNSPVNPPSSLDTPKSKISAVAATNPDSAKSATNGFFPQAPAPAPLARCRTAPSSTFDAALKGKGLVTSEDKLISAQRLKRMKDSMREMSQWCSEVIREGEEEHGAYEENINETPQKPAKSLTVSNIHRASTAPSSTFDALLMNKDLDTADEKLYSVKKLKGMKDRANEILQWCGQVIHEDEEHSGLEESKEDTPKPAKSFLFSKIHLESLAPTSTFDALLMNKDLDTSDEKLYSAKKWKEMKDRVKEIHQWCGQVIHEDEEPSGSEENKEDALKDGLDTETEEVVPAARIEKAGDCFVIQFKCPCDKFYQLLFSKRHIYYMLMPIQQDGPEKESEEEISVERNDEWLVITTKCPCNKGYRILLSGTVCFYELI